MHRILGFLILLSICGLSPHFSQAGPGQKGRPKILPTFEHWAGNPKWDPNVPRLEVDLPSELDRLRAYDLDGKRITLKNLLSGRPLLLVHSSLTCPISRDHCPHADRIRAQFAEELEVVVLYTTEAHPTGSASPYSEEGKEEWLTDRNLIDNILVDEPATLEARIQRACKYRETMQIQSRMIVDSMDNAVWKFFGAGPNTGILINRNGRVEVHQPWIKPSHMAGRIRSMIAHEKGNAILKKLKTAGVAIETWDWDATTVAAAIQRVPEVVHYLKFDRGRSFSWLHKAIESRELEIAKVLLTNGAKSDIQDGNGETPLHYALSRGGWGKDDFRPVIRFMLEHGADLRARSDDLRYSLHFAVESGRLSHVQLLLEEEVPLDLYSIDGVSPLHEALYAGHHEIAALLVKNGAAVDIHVAAALGNLKQVKRFLNAKPSSWTRFQGNSGRSPLTYAVIGGKLEVVQLLLSQQSDEHRFSNEHLSSCLSEAIACGHTASALAILPQALPTSGDLAPPPFQSLQRQLPPDTPFLGPVEPLLHDAATLSRDLLISGLLKRGWDVDELNRDEQTPLHLAAQYGGLVAIRILLDHGADLEAKSGQERLFPCGPGSAGRLNRTPLHHAVIGRQVDAVRFLLSKGAKVEPFDSQQRTPAMFLLPDWKGTDLKEVEAILHLLADAGADLLRKDQFGKTLKSSASEEFPLEERVNGKTVVVGKRLRSPDLLKMLEELAPK